MRDVQWLCFVVSALDRKSVLAIEKKNRGNEERNKGVTSHRIQTNCTITSLTQFSLSLEIGLRASSASTATNKV
jgi:hypothetical protein